VQLAAGDSIDRRGNLESPFSAEIGIPLAFRPFSPRRVCYFLRNSLENGAEKLAETLKKNCAKHAEKPLKICGFHASKLCKTLWITCG